MATRDVTNNSGPRKRKRRRERHIQPAGTLSILNRLLEGRRSIVVNGENRQVRVIEAISLQLQKKALAGDVKAIRVLFKYQRFVNRHLPKSLRLRFVEDAYSRRATRRTREQGDE